MRLDIEILGAPIGVMLIITNAVNGSGMQFEKVNSHAPATPMGQNTLWYYADYSVGPAGYGPVTSDVIRELVNSGSLGQYTSIRKENEQEWKMVCSSEFWKDLPARTENSTAQPQTSPFIPAGNVSSLPQTKVTERPTANQANSPPNPAKADTKASDIGFGILGGTLFVIFICGILALVISFPPSWPVLVLMAIVGVIKGLMSK